MVRRTPLPLAGGRRSPLLLAFAPRHAPLTLHSLSFSDLNSAKGGRKSRPGKGGTRFYRNVGLGFKTPKEVSGEKRGDDRRPLLERPRHTGSPRFPRPAPWDGLF